MADAPTFLSVACLLRLGADLADDPAFVSLGRFLRFDAELAVATMLLTRVLGVSNFFNNVIPRLSLLVRFFDWLHCRSGPLLF